jgi:branched-chain amino acid transport system substrate-binding protein
MSENQTRTWFTLLLIVITVGSLGISGFFYGQFSSYQYQLHTLREEITPLNVQINTLQNQIYEKDGYIQQKDVMIAQFSTLNSNSEALIRQLEVQIAELEERPGHPFLGKTIQIGLTTSSTSGLETTVPLVEDILEPELAEFMDAIGLGITFDFLIEDNQGTAAIALEKTQTFKAMGVNLVIGHGWSSQCQAALSYVNENDMLLLSASSTSPILAIPNDRLFRTCPNDFVQAPAIARMWKSWGVKGVLTIHRADAWGDGLWNVLEPLWEEVGIDDLGRIRYAGEVTEFSSYLDNANDIVTAAIEEYGGSQYVGIQYFSFAEFRTISSQAADYPNLIDTIWMTTESGGRSQLRV